MPLQAFHAGIEQSRAKLLQLRLSLCCEPDAGQRAAAHDALEELESAIEQLGAADQELQAQNDELIQSRNLTEAEQHRFIQLFTSAPVGYAVTDTVGLITEANRALEAMLGFDPGGLTGKPLSLFFRDRDSHNLSDQMARARSERDRRSWECWVNARGRSNPVPVSVTIAPDVRTGTSAPGGFQLIMQNLTEVIESRDRIRDLEDGLWRRVAERTARLSEECDRLKLTVARYVQRYGALPAEHTVQLPESPERAAAISGAREPTP